jgi:LPXTG-site transpeptidase (sortase) family protein
VNGPGERGAATASAVTLPLLLLSAAMVVVGLVLPSDSHPEGLTRAGRHRLVAAVGPIGRPDRLVLPSLGVNSPVAPIETSPDGVLTPPAEVDTVGWWQRSAEPGARKGQVLVTGHTVQQGDGAMDAVSRMKAGDPVLLRSGGRTASYRASDVVVYSRAEVAAHAHELFGQDRGRGRLVLVTCTDWNGTDYESNVVVFADPVRRA